MATETHVNLSAPCAAVCSVTGIVMNSS